MCDKNKECENILKNFKSCLNEMCLPVLDPEVNNGFGKVETKFGILDVSVYVEIAYNSQNKIAKIKIDSSLSVDHMDTFIFLQVLNILNGQMMDIGHICLDPYCEDVFLQTSIDFSNQSFDRLMTLFILKRFLSQGHLFFRILREISQMQKCPFKVLDDNFKRLKDINGSGDETIH